MYDYLTGTLIEKTPVSVVLEVGGIGYALHIPVSTFSVLPAIGEKVKLLTHFVVREDAQVLYGFISEDERDLFRSLISVSGIGPKIAMAMLSGRSVVEVKQAIVEGSLVFLTGISGIGRKTAERIVVELREKIIIEKRVSTAETLATTTTNMLFDDSLQALMELGYRRQSAKEAIQRALGQSKDDSMTVSDLIRASLKHV